ncbi:hypothetical protein [African swine fever virus]
MKNICIGQYLSGASL